MDPSAFPVPHPIATTEPHHAPAPATAAAQTPRTAPAAARLDLTAMEPPRRLAEARLEDVTIDGICGVY